MNKISATIITFNEASKIERALESLQGVADEIVVVDSLSSDSTVELCRRYTERIIARPWPGYREQKQFATDAASHDWILSVDADETVSPELAEALQSWKRAPLAERTCGYRIRRRTYFLGAWIDHTSWARDWQLRLFDRTRARWEGGRVHESVKADGEVGQLQGVLEHYTYESVSEYLRQLENFSTLAAMDANDRGVRSSWFKLMMHPPVEFLRNFLLFGGLLDGVPGLAVSTLSAVSVFFKYLKLWELQNRLAEDSRGER